METQLDSSSVAASDVTVFVGNAPGIEQPDLFRCCPLGCQFYSKDEIEKYKVMEIDLEVPRNGNNEKITCSGVIVHSKPEEKNTRYRIWMYFLDLPEDIKKSLHCIAKDAGTICPFCQNF
jgi:hypothetical protein